jgi:xylulokinase
VEYLIGLDVGTTAVKAGVFGADGRLAGLATREYSLLTPGPDLVELPAGGYWDACVAAVREAVSRSGVPVRAIRGAAISSQGETLIPVSADGLPLRNAIVWLDNRSQDQARRLASRFDQSRVYEITGQTEIAPTWPATKILWLHEHEPDVFSRTDKFLLLEDFLLHKLTGEFVEEHSLASSTAYFDIRTHSWWEPMLEAIGISASRLPVLVPSGTAVRALTSEAASELGLEPDVVVSAGALDQMASAVGAGNISPGQVTESTGAALAICATVAAPTYDPQARMPCHCHAVPGLYALLPWCQTAGMALRWFRDVFGAEEMRSSAQEGRDAYDLLCSLAEAVPPGSEGLIMLPHLAGATCPEMLPQARGVFFGFALGHGKGHFVRAILESVAFMLRRNLDNLASIGVETADICSLGGASRSRLWNQIKADATGRRIAASPDLEAACAGAAMLAGVGAGIYDDVRSGCLNFQAAQTRFEPDPEASHALTEAYNKYIRLFDALEALF